MLAVQAENVACAILYCIIEVLVQLFATFHLLPHEDLGRMECSEGLVLWKSGPESSISRGPIPERGKGPGREETLGYGWPP